MTGRRRIGRGSAEPRPTPPVAPLGPVARFRPVAPLGPVVVAAVVALAVAGCQRQGGPPNETAWVWLRGERRVLRLDSCGRDGRTVFLVGRGSGGVVLQAVVGLDSRRRAVPASSGVTVDLGARTQFGAFGPESQSRKGGGPPPGRVESVSLDGARVRIDVTADRLGARQVSTGDRYGEISVDARCAAG